MTEEEEELPCFSALLDSGSEPGMTEEDERELSASDGDHESSSPHAARNTHNIKEIATHFVLAMTQSNFFINTSLSLTLKIEYSLNTLS